MSGRLAFRGIVASALAIFVAVAVLLFVRVGGPTGIRRIDDLAQLLGALLATVACIWAAIRGHARLRRSWITIGFGVGCWAGGQVIWCYYELISNRSTPFPSIADAGYLVFPIASAYGLWLYPSLAGTSTRRRQLLDAGIVVTALITVSWATTLGAVARAGGDSAFAFAVSLAYPIGDILLVTMTLMGLARESRHRRQLMLLGVSMSAMAVADSHFAYLTATNEYTTGALSDLGWIGAFLLLAVAGASSALSLVKAPGELTGAPNLAPDAPSEFTGKPDRGGLSAMLPYVPLLCAVAALSVRRVQGHEIDLVESVSIGASVTMVLLRQYITILQNRELLVVVAAREAQLHLQAFHDQLTGLANRALFINRAEHALHLHTRDLRPVSVLFCDLDDFKSVNDSLGHAAGDELLIRVAERIRGTLRPGDTLARLGGDEFAVLLEDGVEPATVAARIVATLNDPFSIADHTLAVRASIGIAELSPDSTLSLDELLAHADIAMYCAKRAGKGQLALYDSSMIPPNSADLALRQPLTQAVAERRITIAYQPIVEMATGRIQSLEALARWEHEGTPLGPDQFIPVASRAGVLHALTDGVMEQACEQLANWSRQVGHHRLSVAVNIPPSLVTDQEFPDRVARVMARNGLQVNQLVLEITEDALLHDVPTARLVTHRLREIGARLSLDDFGTGYSSLLHLQRIPLDSLKIDRGFITEVDHDPAAERLVSGILSLGGSLGLAIIAEGIERDTQAAVLHRLGCPLAQGYLFAPPGTAAEITELVVGELVLPSKIRRKPEVDIRVS